MATQPYNLEPIDNLESDKKDEILQGGVEVPTEEEKFTPESIVSSEIEPSFEKEKQPYENFLEQTKKQIASQTEVIPDTSKTQILDSLVQDDSPTRINKLIAVAQEQSIVNAFELALKYDDLYTIDKLHDALAGHLYEELISKGILKIEKE